MPTAVPQPAKSPVKVDLAIPAAPKTPAETAAPRTTAFDNLLRGARSKQQGADQVESRKPEPKSADKTGRSGKSGKPTRGSRADKSRRRDRADEADETDDTQATDEAAETTEVTDGQPTPDAEAAADAEAAEEHKPASDDTCDASAGHVPDADAAAEHGQVAVQAAQDATQQQQQRQAKPGQPGGQDADSIDGVATVDALAGSPGTVVAARTAAAVGASGISNASAEAASAATPAGSAAASAAAKPTVSAIGTATVAAKDLPIQPQAVATDSGDATATGFELPADLTLAGDDALPPDLTLPDDASPAGTLAPKRAATSELPLGTATDALPSAPNAQAGKVSGPQAAQPAPVPQEAEFAQANHDKIVTGVRGQLLPHGGAMQIRLDPPQLGALQVMVEMRNGALTATFQTSNDDATQLLSHSLNQLKHALETTGVTVDKLQVQQAPKSEQSTGGDDQQQQQQQPGGDDHAARQEQQRKEMLRRMWRRVSGAGDPLDFLA